MDLRSTDDALLRYSRQVVLKAMEVIRTSMRGSRRLSMKAVIDNLDTEKAATNPTKAIDKQAEDLMLEALQSKMPKMPGLVPFTVFSEELGIRTFPHGADERDARWVFFLDPIDGTEFAENLQGGWCLLAAYDRRQNEVAVTVAGDIFLNRLYWCSRSGEAEALDFTTHSWFRLDGGPNPKKDLNGARVNVLTTKVGRFRALAKQQKLLDAIDKADGRINLSWGSNLVLQVAAGYADVGIEFAKGFAAYDILPGLFIAERASLTILDLKGNPLTSQLDIDRVFEHYRKDSSKPDRIQFIVAKEPELAHQIVELLRT